MSILSPDLQMVRDNREGHNLSVGENNILRTHLGFNIDFGGNDLPYPSINGAPELIKELELMYPQQYFVVANGAKQALSAIFYALYIKDSVQSKYNKPLTVYHEPPYWPSYPTISMMAGLEFHREREPDIALQGRYISCITSPNNPDGKQYNKHCDIWDAAYANWVYGWNGEEPAGYKAKIYSAAKLFGYSGLRVGWIVSKDPILSDLARQYIEFTTSGVALSSQRAVANILKELRTDSDYVRKMEAARKDMLTNGELFNKHMGPLVDKTFGTPADGIGMFAFFKAKDEEKFRKALDTARVWVVTGEACGMIEPGWIRMSMGNQNHDTMEALVALKKAYNDL